MNTTLFAGLGNPEEKYRNTRHNVGYMFMDMIASRLVIDYSIHPTYNKKFDAEFYKEISLTHGQLLFIKPLLGMNESGIPISAYKNYYKIETNKVIVVHDDLDLKFGEVKAKLGGSNAGHNGLKSIDKYIGTDYIRVRIGIGRPQHKHEVLSYVLGNFTAEEKSIVNPLLIKIAENYDLLINEDLESFNKKFK